MNWLPVALAGGIAYAAYALFARPRCHGAPIIGVSDDTEVAVMGGTHPVTVWRDAQYIGVWPDRNGLNAAIKLGDGRLPLSLVEVYRMVEDVTLALDDIVLGLVLVHEGELADAAPLLQKVVVR